jgi:hypothetical protein
VPYAQMSDQETNFFNDILSKLITGAKILIEQPILDTNAGKQLSLAATDV